MAERAKRQTGDREFVGSNLNTVTFFCSTFALKHFKNFNVLLIHVHTSNLCIYNSFKVFKIIFKQFCKLFFI